MLLPLSELIRATGETLWMVFVAGSFACLLGLPLGVLCFATDKKPLWFHPYTHRSLSLIINITRSIPFIILMLAVIPFTRWLTGTSIGTQAAIVPLTLAAIPFFGRLVESNLQALPLGLLETGEAMGASPWQILIFILLPEARVSMIQSLTLTFVNLVGYSAMAGTVGGGGLGDLAIRYGYQRFDFQVMLITLLILILLVQLIQHSGDMITRRLLRHQ